jgi:hypothetical protein
MAITPAAALALLLATCHHGSTMAAMMASPSCVVVRDAASAQDVKIEAHGANAVRVRAVASGGVFLDDPDVVSAFTPLPTTTPPGDEGVTLSATDAGELECATVDLDATTGERCGAAHAHRAHATPMITPLVHSLTHSSTRIHTQ